MAAGWTVARVRLLSLSGNRLLTRARSDSCRAKVPKRDFVAQKRCLLNVNKLYPMVSLNLMVPEID